MNAKFIVLSLLLLLSGCQKDDSSRHFNGYLEGDYIHISPYFSGRISKIHVKEAQSVNSGQLLLELEDTLETINLNSAKANLNSLEARLEDLNLGMRKEEIEQIKAKLDEAKAASWLASKNWERTKKLIAKNSISDKEADIIKAEFQRANAVVSELEASLKIANLPARENQIKSLKAQIKAAKEDIKAKEWQLNETKIYAPKAGKIESVFFKPSEWVANGQPVILLLPLSELKAKFFVPISDIASFKEGEKIEISCKGYEDFSATIVKIASKPEYTPPIIYSENTQDTLTYRVEALLDNPSEFLHPSLPISVRQKR
ncbi:HlyD family secretion protein [Campylobacter sp.]|uniref:HlyD family secretion protein n=1 Tax=Campylobacter sp. TaxID=205 RepID=UPI00270F9110|nr:HlyD family efflux transporter periplasmic adaptor subunit [Campylobacter sp.]